MSEDSSTKLVAIPQNGVTELIDPNQSKIDQLELEYEEVKANLMRLSAVNERVLESLEGLARTSQHHLMYASLAQMVKAANETQRELGNTLKHKQSLIQSLNKDEEKIVEPASVTNNNLMLTTTDMIDLIKARNGIQE